LSNVPTNLIPTKVTGLPEYLGSSTLGYMPYIIDGRTYKVQFANIAAVGAVPSTREINTGSGLGGGGDLSANRTLYILPGGVDDSMLTSTGVTAGTYGSAENVPVFTVNAQGRITGVTETPIVLSNYVPTSRTITAGDGLTGGGNLSANRSFAVNFSSTTPEPLGPGSPGVSTVAAREDHVHPAVDLSDTTETQGVLPLSRGGTGNSLSPVVGAIAYSSNDKLYLTPTAGNAGQVLTSDGGAGAPYWQTITGTGTVTSVDLTAGTGISVSGGPITGAGSINVVNTAPDQIVSLTGAGTTSITGTYPNFTITSTGGTGTVSSVDASGGTTGLSFTGGPITTSGTLTLGGTLGIANGGTGATTAATARTNLGAAASGANSDITSLSGITGAISTVDSITFDTAAAVTVGAGQIAWNVEDGTINIGMGYDAVTQQVGLEQYFRIKASAAITNGQCVMFTGSVGASGVLTGAPATGVTNPQYIMGVATMDIALNGFGYITSFGLVRGINTTGSSVGETWADGDILYYNPAYTGGLTKVEPVAPNPKVVVASVVNAASGGSGSLFIRVQAEPYLQGLTDVYAPSPISNGQILIGDGPQSRWEAATLTAGTNVSITNAAGAITINASDQYTGTVTSVAASGGTTGLTFSGSPITTSGTLTLGGTLAAANGGTGLTSPGTAGNVLTSDGTVWTSAPPAAGGITYTTVKTANYTAAANDGVQTDTSGGAFTVTLPATPSVGDQVFVVDSAGSWATNNLTVGRNGSTIEGSASDLVCNISSVSVQFVYSGTTWDVFAQVGGAGAGVVSVAGGGTGVSTLTGYVKGSGTSPLTASATIPTSDLTGTLAAANGGTGLTSPGTSGNVLTSDGTNWTSTALPSSAVQYPQNIQSANYTLVLGDAGKQIFHPVSDTTVRTYTIPANSSVAFPIGTVVLFTVENGGVPVKVAITSDTLVFGAGTTGNLFVPVNNTLMAIKVTATKWMANFLYQTGVASVSEAMAVGAFGSPRIVVYPWSATGFGTKYSDPGTLPTGAGNGVSFTANGDAIAVAHTTTPFVTAYPWTSAGFGTKYTDPGTLPAGTGNGVAFTVNGDAIAIAHTTTPYIAVYPWNSSTGFGTKYTDPATLPTGTGNDVAFSPGGNAIAVAHDASPGITVYPWNSGTGFGTKYTDPATLPSTNGYGVAFNTAGDSIAVTHSSSPYITVYPWNSGTGFGTKYTNPVATPSGQGDGVAFSPSGNAIAVAHFGSPYVTAYPWSATGFGSKYTNPVTLPAGNSQDVAFSSGGDAIAVAHSTTPYITAYPWTSAGFGTKYTNPATLPSIGGNAVDFGSF
jgi:hypothetical protein